VDEDGEWVWLVFIVVKGAINMIENSDDISLTFKENGWKGLGKGAAYFLTGAGAGAATYFLGGFGTAIGEYGQEGLNSLIRSGDFRNFDGVAVTRRVVVNGLVNSLGIGDCFGKAASRQMDKLFDNELINNLTEKIIGNNIDNLLMNVGESTWEKGNLKDGINDGWNSYIRKGGWINSTLMGAGEGVLKTYDFRTNARETNKEAAQDYFQQHKTMNGFEIPLQPDLWSEQIYSWQMNLSLKMNIEIYSPIKTYFKNFYKDSYPDLYPGYK